MKRALVIFAYWILHLRIVFSLQEEDFFQGCDNAYNLSAGLTYLESPYYPNDYPAGTSCRYVFTAPLDHTIELNCKINLSKEKKPCSTQFLWISLDGNKLFREDVKICETIDIKWKTVFRQLAMAYISLGGTGKFHCEFNAVPQPCDCGWSTTEKIVNGEEAQRNEFPSLVILHDVREDIKAFCGGAIITHRHILTAAQCARLHDTPGDIRVYVGMHDLSDDSETPYEEEYFVERMIVHPNYRPDPVLNDIAIVVTATDIEWRRGVGPICLPSPVQLQDLSLSDIPVDIAGWGTTSLVGEPSDLLYKITVSIADYEDCASYYQNTVAIDPVAHICTYDDRALGRDTCKYDKGGPVIYRDARQFLMGIVSFGKNCGVDSNTKSVHTRVSSDLSWIDATIGSGICYVEYIVGEAIV